MERQVLGRTHRRRRGDMTSDISWLDLAHTASQVLLLKHLSTVLCDNTDLWVTSPTVPSQVPPVRAMKRVLGQPHTVVLSPDKFSRQKSLERLSHTSEHLPIPSRQCPHEPLCFLRCDFPVPCSHNHHFPKSKSVRAST